MKDLIKRINATPYKAFLAVTGGGASFIGDFLSVPGGSNTILGFYVPYDQRLFEEFAGKPDKFVSEDGADALACASYLHAQTIANVSSSIGIGASCSLATDNERVGRLHNIYIAGHSHNGELTIHLPLMQGDLFREEEEKLASFLILATLGQLCGVQTIKESIDRIQLPSGLTYRLAGLKIT